MSGLSAVNLGAVGISQSDLVDYIREVLREQLALIARREGHHGARATLAAKLHTSGANISQWVNGAPRTTVSRKFEQSVADLVHGGSTAALQCAAAERTGPEWTDLSPMALQALGILAVRRRGIDFVRSAKIVLATHRPERMDAAKLATLIEQNHDGQVGDAGDDQATGEEALRATKKGKKK